MADSPISHQPGGQGDAPVDPDASPEQRAQMEQASIQDFFSSTFDFENDTSLFLKNNFDYYLNTGE